jgi:hypothetical protein
MRATKGSKCFFFEKKKQKTFENLVFLHIPKCSGIAVSFALLDAARAPRVFFGFDRAFFGGFSDFASVAEENRSFIHLTPDTIPKNERFVRAHMSLSTLRAAYPRGTFMTVLREPVCRILSHFAFWRGFSAAQKAAWGSWAARSGLAQEDLETFLDAPEIACQIDNVATRLLLWPHRHIPDSAMIDPAHDAALLKAAHARLNSLDFVDAIENPSFHTHLSEWIGAPLIASRQNETETLPPALRTRLDHELTPRAASLLTARSRLDLALWRSTLRAQAPRVDVDAMRQEALMRGIARTTLLLAGIDYTKPH